MNREEWLKTLKSDIKPSEHPELDAEIRGHITTLGGIQRADGIYGDTAKFCNAYIKREILSDHGIQTEFYGCCYKWNGVIRADLIDCVATVKRVLMTGVGFLFKFKFLAVLLLSKKIRKELIIAVEKIYDADLAKFITPNVDKKWLRQNELRPASRELIRVFTKCGFSKKLTNCGVLFLEADNAYWQRFQDLASNISKENILKSGIISEIERLKELYLLREKQIEGKMVKLFNLLILAITISPKFQKTIRDILLELDVDKFIPGENDIYFTLNRDGYDFRGESFEKRREEFERLNKLNNNTILNI